MIPELKKFWSNYNPYKLHPEDENYLGQNKLKYCLEISIEELRAKYGSDLKSDNTREKFLNDKQNKNKILNNLFVVPFFGDVENARKKRGRIDYFGILGIQKGTTLTFSKDENITCVVSDNGKIIFRDKETTLSGSALLITNEMGYDWGQVQGAGYWCYQGKTLRVLVSEK